MNTNYLIPVNFMEVCYMSSGTWFKTKKKATPLVPPVSNQSTIQNDKKVVCTTDDLKQV
jgi:hypothetical protein